MVSERMFRYYKELVPSKQVMLALSVSLAMQEEAVDALLRRYGYCLSDSIAGDAVVRWYVGQNGAEKSGERLLFEINWTLERMGLPLLMTRQA